MVGIAQGGTAEALGIGSPARYKVNGKISIPGLAKLRQIVTIGRRLEVPSL